MFEWLFLKHPRSLDETYFEHAAAALGFGAELLLASLACFVHALVPGFFQRTASRIVGRVQARIVRNRQRASGAIDFDYAI